VSVREGVFSQSRWWIAPAVVGVWAVGGLALAYYDRPLSDALWITLNAVWLGYWLGAAAFVIAVVFLVRRRRAARGAGWSAVAMALLAPTLWMAFPRLAAAGNSAQFRHRFARFAPQYLAIAAELERAGATARDGERRGIRFVVDHGPPLRVAFPQPGGILDNWEGVVYDPTGTVRAARGWTSVQGRQEFTAPASVRRLFGGDLVECEPVRDAFYRCWFT
jgi:hypothetical protein